MEQKGMNPASADTGWICPRCGKADNVLRFCPNCGERRPELKEEIMQNKTQAVPTPAQTPQQIQGMMGPSPFMQQPGPAPYSSRDSAETIETLKRQAKPHGPLTKIVYGFAAGGMMFNSNSLLRMAFTKTESGADIFVAKKEPFQNREEAYYLCAPDMWQSLCDFVEREQLAAFCELQYADPMTGVADHFGGGADLTLQFDDTSLGGLHARMVHISVSALRQHGLERLADDLIGLLNDAVERGTKIEKTAVWVCPLCHHGNGDTAFCSECWATRPEKPTETPAETVAALKAQAKPHGPLSGIVYDTFSHGTMNSDSMRHIEIKHTEKDTSIVVYEKKAFQKKTRADYLCSPDAWQALCDFVEREQLEVFCKLKNRNQTPMGLVGVSVERITLTFNNTSAGGQPIYSVLISPTMLNEYGIGDLTVELLRLLDDAIEHGTKIEKPVAWICHVCNHGNPDDVFFCIECGAIKS